MNLNNTGSSIMVRCHLEILNGPHAGQRLWVQLGQVMAVGSSDRADVALEGDPELRDVHFRLVLQHSGCYVECLDTDASILVDGCPADRRRLRDGNQLRAGATQFHVSITGSAADSDHQFIDIS